MAPKMHKTESQKFIVEPRRGVKSDDGDSGSCKKCKCASECLLIEPLFSKETPWPVRFCYSSTSASAVEDFTNVRSSSTRSSWSTDSHNAGFNAHSDCFQGSSSPFPHLLRDVNSNNQPDQEAAQLGEVIDSGCNEEQEVLDSSPGLSEKQENQPYQRETQQQQLLQQHFSHVKANKKKHRQQKQKGQPPLLIEVIDSTGQSHSEAAHLAEWATPTSPLCPSDGPAEEAALRTNTSTSPNGRLETTPDDQKLAKSLTPRCLYCETGQSEVNMQQQRKLEQTPQCSCSQSKPRSYSKCRQPKRRLKKRKKQSGSPGTADRVKFAPSDTVVPWKSGSGRGSFPRVKLQTQPGRFITRQALFFRGKLEPKKPAQLK